MGKNKKTHQKNTSSGQCPAAPNGPFGRSVHALTWRRSRGSQAGHAGRVVFTSYIGVEVGFGRRRTPGSQWERAVFKRLALEIPNLQVEGHLQESVAISCSLKAMGVASCKQLLPVRTLHIVPWDFQKEAACVCMCCPLHPIRRARPYNHMSSRLRGHVTRWSYVRPHPCSLILQIVNFFLGSESASLHCQPGKVCQLPRIQLPPLPQPTDQESKNSLALGPARLGSVCCR